MTDAIRFALPSQAARGHALPHASGSVSLTFLTGPRLMTSFTLSGLSTSEARTIGDALILAADQAAFARIKADADGAEERRRDGNGAAP